MRPSVCSVVIYEWENENNAPGWPRRGEKNRVLNLCCLFTHDHKNIQLASISRASVWAEPKTGVDGDRQKIARCDPRAGKMPLSVMCLPCKCGNWTLDSQHSHKKPGAGGPGSWAPATEFPEAFGRTGTWREVPGKYGQASAARAGVWSGDLGRSRQEKLRSLLGVGDVEARLLEQNSWEL